MYRTKNANVKERMLLVLNVVYYGKVATHVAEREIHKSKGWASQWLKRYREEGLEGLNDRQKGGRHPKISRQVEYRIKTILKESNTGWTTKQVEEVIIKESGTKYHSNYVYYIVRKWGFKQKVPRKVHVNTASKEEKEEFKKRPIRYLWMFEAYKSRKVKDYLDKNNDTLIPVYLPTASPEFMMLEEVWNIAKQDLLVLKHYSSFEDFKENISLYFRTKRFGLNMRNYLPRTV